MRPSGEWLLSQSDERLRHNGIHYNNLQISLKSWKNATLHMWRERCAAQWALKVSREMQKKAIWAYKVRRHKKRGDWSPKARLWILYVIPVIPTSSSCPSGNCAPRNQPSSTLVYLFFFNCFSTPYFCGKKLFLFCIPYPHDTPRRSSSCFEAIIIVIHCLLNTYLKRLTIFWDLNKYKIFF